VPKKKLSDEKHNHSEMFIQSPTQHHSSSRRRNECFFLREGARFRTQRHVITILLTKTCNLSWNCCANANPRSRRNRNRCRRGAAFVAFALPDGQRDMRESARLRKTVKQQKGPKTRKKGQCKKIWYFKAFGVHACVRAGVGVVVGWVVERRV
jgi:hypothetical protein